MTRFIDTIMMRGMAALTGLRARLADERGQGVLEYAMLGGLIAGGLAAAFVLADLTGALNSMASGIADCIRFNASC